MENPSGKVVVSGRLSFPSGKFFSPTSINSPFLRLGEGRRESLLQEGILSLISRPGKAEENIPAFSVPALPLEGYMNTKKQSFVLLKSLEENGKTCSKESFWQPKPLYENKAASLSGDGDGGGSDQKKPYPKKTLKKRKSLTCLSGGRASVEEEKARHPAQKNGPGLSMWW